MSSFATGGGATREVASDPLSVFGYIGGLPFQRNANPNAYLIDSNDVTAVRVSTQNPQSVSGQCAKIRYSALPQVENAGSISDLQLPTGAGLYEAAHFTLFTDVTPHVLAMEFNQIAPRHTALANYLVQKLYGHPTIPLDRAFFSPIYRGDVIDQIMQMGKIAELELSIRRDGISEIEAADEMLGTALRAQANYAPEMASVGIYLKREKYARSGGGGQQLKERVGRIVQRFLPLFSEAKVRIESSRGDGGRLVTKDLLQDKMIHEVSITREANGTIDSADMFEKIEQAYQANRDLLQGE